MGDKNKTKHKKNVYRLVLPLKIKKYQQSEKKTETEAVLKIENYTFYMRVASQKFEEI